MKDFVATEFPGRVGELLQARSHLCRPCFRSIGTLERLKKDVAGKEEKLRSMIREAGVERGFSTSVQQVVQDGAPPDAPSTSAQSYRTPPKRGCVVDVSPSPKRRRMAHDTPTRRSLANMMPGEKSPAVVILKKGKTDSRALSVPKSSGLKK
jgi:hypothetical protein